MESVSSADALNEKQPTVLRANALEFKPVVTGSLAELASVLLGPITTRSSTTNAMVSIAGTTVSIPLRRLPRRN